MLNKRIKNSENFIFQTDNFVKINMLIISLISTVNK
jgi:hypothetical protein